MSKKLMRLREEKSNKIIAEIRMEPLDIRISVFFVAIFIAFTEYMRVAFGENFIPARPFVAFGVIIAIIWQFAGRGWDLFLHDPIVNRIAHNGKIRRRGRSGYQIMDRGKRARYNFVIKGSPNRGSGSVFFKLIQEQPIKIDYDLEGSNEGRYMNIQCQVAQDHVFNTRFSKIVDLSDEETAIRETKIALEVSNPTDRMLAFVTSTLIIFKFQEFSV
ncbi:MAG: hypothetical protein GPJ54_20470 [Candidatus Heimdallarchaeota archaeon]|nr:hypothetical protein [Candidatus Heimdallarchaeota archaeon]